MLPICPECRAGKHGNCTGVGYILDDGTEIPCGCSANKHV